ncbi:MAG: hypothetical protein ACJ72V_13970 [Nitrososphaeraceae archaeon]
MFAADNNNIIDWNEVVKKEARGINGANFGEVQLIMGDTVITEKGITDKKDFTCKKASQINLMGVLYGLESQRMKHITRIGILKKSCKSKYYCRT